MSDSDRSWTIDSDPLYTLWRSTLNLYERFSFLPSIENARHGILEESYETVDALNSKDVSHYADELVDILVFGISGLLALGGTIADLDSAIDRVITKNDAKTNDTHVLYNNKITKRTKIAQYEYENHPTDTPDCVFGQFHVCNSETCLCRRR